MALYLDFDGAKNIYVLQVLIWGFGGCWRFLTRVWHPDIDLDMVTGLWYTHVQNFGYVLLDACTKCCKIYLLFTFSL